MFLSTPLRLALLLLAWSLLSLAPQPAQAQGALQAGLSIVRQRPIVLREGEEPLLGLFLMHRAIDLPERFRNQTHTEPPLCIRRSDGSVSVEYSAIKLSFGFPP